MPLYQWVSLMYLDTEMRGRDISMNEVQFSSSKGSESPRKTWTHTMTLCYDENHHWDISTRRKCVGIIAIERPVNRINQGNHPLGGIWRENVAGLTKLVLRREDHLS